MSEPLPQALLMAVKLPDVEFHEFDASLAELARLVTTLGYVVVGTITQQRTALVSASVIGGGKLQQLAERTGGSGSTGPTLPKVKDKARLRREAEQEEDEPDFEPYIGPDSSLGEGPIDLIVADHELTPTQLRNLERATGTSVLDRTGVIIEIFHRHARTQKARLEVEIARLNYTAPRLRESPRGKERQQGRGAGEAAIELDRRRIRDRIAELREQLEAIQKEEGVRRSHRRDARRVALVGYTNAGKSSWMRMLTSSQVLVEDKLFATLDTTVRALAPETKPRILVSDTVGFIRKLPHDLVASFKSTLDEAAEASLVIYVADASDPDCEQQLHVTRSVLTEIGAHTVPSHLLLNKVDQLTEEQRRDWQRQYPDAWLASSRDPADVARVRQLIIDFFESFYLEAELVVPYDRQALVSDMHENGRVIEQEYAPEGVRVRFRADRETLERLRSALSA